MSYYRGMGVILRMPTRTPGFRGMRGLRGRMRGLGQDATDYSTLPLPPAGPLTSEPLTPLTQPADTGMLPDPLIQMQYQSVIDQNPTDYVSPQAAIAAGLDPNKVNAVWAQGLAKYPTQQAAIAAGIAPTVITQFWQASRAYVGVPSSTPSWLSANNLLLGGGILFGLSLLMGGGRRRR